MAEIKQIKEILSCDEIVKDELLILLKIEAKHINIQEIIKASLFLISDSDYVQENYRRQMIEAYTSGFITRIKEVKDHNLKDETLLDVREVKEAVDLLLNQEKEASKRDDFNPAFSRIARSYPSTLLLFWMNRFIRWAHHFPVDLKLHLMEENIFAQ